MQSSSTTLDIYSIQLNKVTQWIDQTNETSLHNYRIGYDNSMTDIYISAEVHIDSLDSGTDPTPAGIKWAKVVGTFPGDEPHQIIAKRLGGFGYSPNMFPLNQQVDISMWKQDEQRIYEYVAKESNRHVNLLYALEYDQELDEEGSNPEISRLYKLHYQFKLYQDNEFTGKTITGMTNPDFYSHKYHHVLS